MNRILNGSVNVDIVVKSVDEVEIIMAGECKFVVKEVKE
jgi:hypothetical protein